MEKIISRTANALKKNNIGVIRAHTKDEIITAVKEMLYPGCTISAGGSVSVKESGVWELINDPQYCFYNRNRKGITPEEQQEVFRQTIGCDFYFCSANAITENGELLNVDGFANRISAISFGPKKVIIIVGKNKIVPNLDSAFLRVKKIAAPKNCVRLGIETPCYKLGHCISLLNNEHPSITDGCSHPRRICRNYLISAMQGIKDRITVILCDEDLGY